jgi:hypothetical protein
MLLWFLMHKCNNVPIALLMSFDLDLLMLLGYLFRLCVSFTFSLLRRVFCFYYLFQSVSNFLGDLFRVLRRLRIT